MNLCGACPATATPADWLVVGLVLVCLVPVWAFPFFPTQDGAAHVENARPVGQLLESAAPGDCVVLHAQHLIVFQLVRASMSVPDPVDFPPLAEKLFLNVTLILFRSPPRLCPERNILGGTVDCPPFPCFIRSHSTMAFTIFALPSPSISFCSAIGCAAATSWIGASFSFWCSFPYCCMPRYVLVWVMGTLAIGVLALLVSGVGCAHRTPRLFTSSKTTSVAHHRAALVTTLLLLTFAARAPEQPLQLDTNWRVALLNLRPA